MKVFSIKVPEVWHQTYYVRSENAEKAFFDFRTGKTEYKLGESNYEETLEHFDGFEWEVQEVADPEELIEVRQLPVQNDTIQT